MKRPPTAIPDTAVLVQQNQQIVEAIKTEVQHQRHLEAEINQACNELLQLRSTHKALMAKVQEMGLKLKQSETENAQLRERLNHAPHDTKCASQKKEHVFTHQQLVKRAVSWLRNHEHCRVVFAEVHSAAGEIADAIGWRSGFSILIECKASRSDFLADSKKFSRRFAGEGVGDMRYYMAPKGIITPDDLPEGWGLVEIDDHRARVVVKATHRDRETNALRAEIRLLVSVLRRIQTREFVTIAPWGADDLDTPFVESFSTAQAKI